jgi:hypothetical protein
MVLSLPVAAACQTHQGTRGGASPSGTSPAQVSSQSAAVSARTEILAGERLTIGDPFTLRIHLEGRAGLSAGIPSMETQGLEPFHLVDSRADGGRLNLTLVPFDTGKLSIPRIEVPYGVEGESSGAVTIDAVPVEVLSVLGDGEDGEQLAEIKPPVGIRPDWRRAVTWFLGGALVLAGAGAGLLAVWRRSGGFPPGSGIEGLTERDPADAARAALERLGAGPTLARTGVKPFHDEISRVLRRYLQMRYRFAACERTTAEIRGELRRARIDGVWVAEMVELLALCDDVKFGQAPPDERACTRTLRGALRCVERSRPRRGGAERSIA